MMTKTGRRPADGWLLDYHYALCPSYIRFALAMAGIEAPALTRAAELADGASCSLLIHAACNQDMTWTGLASDAGRLALLTEPLLYVPLSNLEIRRVSREEAGCAFDLIGNVWSWSWLPERDRLAALDTLRRHLAKSGLFCLAHLTLPGQQGTVGLGKILATLAFEHGGDVASSSSHDREILKRAIEFADTNPGFFRSHWSLRDTLEHLLVQGAGSVPPQLLEPGFRPQFFGEVARDLADADLSWACSWTASSEVAGLHLTPKQSEFLKRLPDTQREQLRDFVLNAGARDDIFMKGGRQAVRSRLELIEPTRFVLVRPASEFTYAVPTSFGEVGLARPLYAPLLEALGALKPLGAADLHDRAGKRWSIDEVVDALAVLVDEGFVRPVNPPTTVEASVSTAQALNSWICRLARDGGGFDHLGSPLTGGGVEVPRVHRLLLSAYSDGARTAEDLAAETASVLQRDEHDAGSAVPDPMPEVRRKTEEFLNTWMPIYSSLMLVPG